MQSDSTSHEPSPNSARQDRLMTIKEVAELVQLKRATLYMRMAAGDFPLPVKVTPGPIAGGSRR